MELTTGIIILAAGNSSRLGRPKQLLELNGYTLLRNTIIQAKLVPNSFVVVVTGAYKDLIDKELAYTAAKVVHNPHWEEGMASSISLGLYKLRASNPEIQACIVTVCDQPFVTAKIFSDLLDVQATTGKGIVASAYAGTLGTPVLFGNGYFNELLGLKGQEGAKKLLSKFSDDTAPIAFEKGAVDIDTIDDYNNLINP
jgi:molybdenum cofactor cytidylyltransferase